MIEDAIEKAIEGGYDAPWTFGPCFCHGDEAPRHHDQIKVFLDPFFWESLGKVLGWENWGSKENPEMIDFDVKFRSYLEKPPSVESGKTAAEQAIQWNQNKNITAIKLNSILHGEIFTP